jgi:hypothetical protein
MKALLLLAGAFVALGGCAAGAPQMTWGKPGVSKVDYGTDVGMCTGLAASQKSDNGAKNAGGIDGRGIENAASPAPVLTQNPTNTGPGPQSTHVEAPLPSAGSYSGMASADFAQRAATQQRTQEMAVKRARAEALKGCLVDRGYREIALTKQQVAHLASLQKGSSEYHEYLYTLGSDPEVVASQAMPAK